MQDDESAVSHLVWPTSRRSTGCGPVAVVAVMMFHGGISLIDRRVHGSRRLLRPVRLPHHLAAGRRVAPDRSPSSWGRSGPAGRAVCCPALLLMLLFVAFFASVIVPKGTYGALRLDALVHAALREQLALHPGQLQLLQRDGVVVAADPHLVAGGGGAVLPDLAAGGARACCASPGACEPCSLLCCAAAVALGRLDVRAVHDGGRQHQPGVPRHRHPLPVPLHRLRAGRRARAADPARPRAGRLAQGRAVAARRRPGEARVRRWSASSAPRPWRSPCGW